MILSSQNRRVKWVRSLNQDSKVRKDEGLFIVEGVRLAEEALASGWQVEWVIFTQALNERGRELLRSFSDTSVQVDEVSEQVMRSVSDTQSPQGILLVLRALPCTLPASVDLMLIPDSIRDPGNMGTLFRTAAAAGVQSVQLPPGSVDPYAPKVVRAAMGAHFHLAIETVSWEGVKDTVSTHRLNVFLADANRGIPYTQADFRSPFALIIGGEAEGAGSWAHELATHYVHIPMPGYAESLNAGTAAAVLLFEALRQRENIKDS